MELVKKLIEFVMDILETIVFVGSIFIVVYLFIAAPHSVRGGSMDPTFKNGDYIITSKISYKFATPRRGDVIVFASLKNPDIDFIKRIVGLPGDEVMIKDGKVYLNGEILAENYIQVTTNAFESGFIREGMPVVVPEGDLFVLGDNRPRSSDSREFGFIPAENIIGRVIYRYYPPQKIGPIHNPFEALLFALYP